MGKWLAKYKNSPKMPIVRTDITDTLKVIDFESEAQKIRAALKKHGIAKIYSRTLDDVVYWAKNDTEATKIPKGATVYTLDELRHLISIKADSEASNQVHQAKKNFGGKVTDEVQDLFTSGDGGCREPRNRKAKVNRDGESGTQGAWEVGKANRHRTAVCHDEDCREPLDSRNNNICHLCGWLECPSCGSCGC